MINKEKNVRITITIPKSLDDLTNQLLEQIPNTTKSRMYITAMALLLQESKSPANGDNTVGEKEN